MFIRFFVKYFICFHNRSFVFGIKGLFPDSKFFFLKSNLCFQLVKAIQIQTFVSKFLLVFKFGASFPESNFFFQNLDLHSKNKASNLSRKNKLEMKKSCYCRITLQFLKRSFSSGNKALNLNWNSSLETKLRFLKRSFDFRNKNSILERRIRFWKHRIY